MKRTITLLLTIAALTSCTVFHPKRPKTYTPAPNVDSARKGVEDAKDYNRQIDAELDDLEKELRK